MREQPGALDMPQKTDAESDAGVRAFDKSRKIGDDKCAPTTSLGRFAQSAICGNYAESRLKCREWIVCNFRMRSRDARNQRGFPGVREAHQPHIGQQFQFKMQVALL